MKVGIATFQLAPFFDAGLVWNDSDNPNQLPEQRFLAGVGLGVIWQPQPNLNLRLDYGVPLIDLDDRGTNVQDEGFYFSVNYRILVVGKLSSFLPLCPTLRELLRRMCLCNSLPH